MLRAHSAKILAPEQTGLDFTLPVFLAGTELCKSSFNRPMLGATLFIMQITTCPANYFRIQMLRLTAEIKATNTDVKNINT